MMDAPASQYVFENWPTPIVLSGFDIGEKIITGKQTAAMPVEGSPVREAYKMCLEQDNPEGRNSWDQSAVLVAVRGAEPYFGLETGTLTVTPCDSFERSSAFFSTTIPVVISTSINAVTTAAIIGNIDRLCFLAAFLPPLPRCTGI